MRGLTILLCCMLPAVQAQDNLVKPDTIRLDEYTITEYVPLNDKSVLDLNRTNRFTSIDKLNARLEGISLIRRGAYAMEPQMDGFSGGQINLTVDGMKIFGACTDRMDPVSSYIEPDNLESFKITRGTHGGQHGSSVGGSFDMVLREPSIGESKVLSVEAGLGYESASRGTNVNGALEISRKKWAFRTSGTYRNHNSYRGGDGLLVPYSYFEKVNLHSAAKFELSKNNTLRFDFLMDDAYDVGYPSLPMDVGLAKARIYSMEYQRQDSHHKLYQLKAKLYYNSIYHLMDDSNRDSVFRLEDETGYPGDTVFMRMDMPGWSNTYGFFLEGKTRLGNKSQLYFKVDDYFNMSRAYMTMYMTDPKNPGEPPMYAETWPDTYRNVAGIYLRASTRISKTVNMTLDGRLDMSQTKVLSETGYRQFSIFGYDIDKAYVKLPKSINANFHIGSGGTIQIEGGVGYAERLPTTSEMFGFFLYNALDGYDYLGNPEIDLEHSIHYWTKLHFSWPSLKLSIRNRYSQVSNYILGIIDPDTPQMNLYASGVKRYRNIPAAVLYGSSLQVQWNPTANLTLYSLSQYTYGGSRDGDPLPLIPPLKNLSICKFKRGIASIQLEGEFSSSQTRINTSFGESITPAYSIFHLRTSFRWHIREIEFEAAAGLENILNKSYSEHLDWGNYLRSGRSLFLNLRLII